jgi:selenocysteine lyase/cysteine desulfurase
MNIATQYVPMGAHVLAVEGEFPSVTQPFLARGCEVSFVPQDDSPHDAIAAALRPETAAIAMSHVQYQSGRRYDLEVLRALAGDARLLFVDATQSVGAVSVAAGGADMLTASHYKWLCAGYGAGLVTLSERLLQRPSPVFGWRSHADPYALDERDATPHPGAQRLEMGHPPFAPVLALGGALSHLAQTVQDPWPRIAHLQSHLRAEMARLGLAPPTTPEGHSGIAVIPADDPAGLKAALAQRGIMASARAGSVRLSTHAFNSEDDVSAAVHALAELSQA